MKNEKGNCLLGAFILILTGALVISVMIGVFSYRLDFASGQHRITPTSIDTDFWGNYRVYYKTSEYTKDTEENYYFIDKNNIEIKKQMEECIKNQETVMIYYDKYVGFKGISAPDTSPIIKIEILENN